MKVYMCWCVVGGSGGDREESIGKQSWRISTIMKGKRAYRKTAKR